MALVVLSLGLLGHGVPAMAQGVTVSINAPAEVAVDRDFTAMVDVTDLTDFDAGHFDISFYSTVLRLDNVGAGLIGTSEIPVLGWHEMSPGTYRIIVNVSGVPGVSGSGYLAVLHFRVIGSLSGSSSAINISNGFLNDNDGDEITATWTGDSVVVYEAVVITTTSLPCGVVGDAYSSALKCTGGNGSYTWSILSGSLPDGLSLNSAGEVSGKPTTAGIFSFTAEATDGVLLRSKLCYIVIFLAQQTITADAPAIVETQDKKIVIYFPQGAVTGETIITIKEKSSSPPAIPSRFKAGGTYFTIEATSDGNAVTKLEKEITITIKYSDEDVTAAGGDPRLLTLAYYDEDLGQWIDLTTIVNTEEKTLTVTTDHLSKWMVLARKAGASALPWILAGVIPGSALLGAGVYLLLRRRRSQQIVS